MYSYAGLLYKLKEKGLTKSSLTKNPGISSTTIAKISKNEKISKKTLDKLAQFLNCSVNELYRPISDNALLQRLRDEEESRLSGGIYHELQIRMTYNSNHIEGSKLNEDQTRYIYETRSIDATDNVSVDDIIETVNHFRCISYVINQAEEPLTEDLIKHLHRLLKQGTEDLNKPWIKIGDYKTTQNTVGSRETVKPEDVSRAVNALLTRYEKSASKSIKDIIQFHFEFECIHPFSDGNGRVGRLIALKECLRHNIVPFLIEDTKKQFYYRGLSEWEYNSNYLIETCLDGQDTFQALIDRYGIDYPE